MKLRLKLSSFYQIIYFYLFSGEPRFSLDPSDDLDPLDDAAMDKGTDE